jgi:hypothetical protein
MIPAMLSKMRRGVAGGLAAAVVCLPATARADAGIAMLPVTRETMWFFLLLVIIIEIIYLQSRLRTRFRRTLVAVTSVNTATTGLGFPLAWLLCAGLDSYVGFPGGVAGAFNNMHFLPFWVCQKIFPDLVGMHAEIWVVLGLFITLMVPSYLVTRLIKTWIFDWYDLLRYEGDIKPAILTANRLSYLLLVLTGCILLLRTFQRL